MSEVTVKNFDELIKALTKNMIPVKETITQWEYTWMKFSLDYTLPHEENFRANIKRLGEDGWEAVGSFPDSIILFKRPLV